MAGNLFADMLNELNWNRVESKRIELSRIESTQVKLNQIAYGVLKMRTISRSFCYTTVPFRRIYTFSHTHSHIYVWCLFFLSTFVASVWILANAFYPMRVFHPHPHSHSNFPANATRHNIFILVGFFSLSLMNTLCFETEIE